MNSIFKFFVDNWKFSFLLTLLTVIIGILGLGILQRETFPPVNFATVTVQTFYPGASPEEVQDQVTRVIEDELRGIAGFKDVRSVSQSGRSSITIRIDIDRKDSNQIVDEIQRGVSRAATKLPSQVEDAPLVTELKAKEIPVLELALVGENKNRSRDILAERLKEELEDVNGVANVRYSGYQEREIQVLLDREKLVARTTGLTEVVNSLTNRLKNVPAGSLESDTQNTLVRLIGKTSSVEEIQNIVIRSNDTGTLTRVKDLGRVIDASKKSEILVRVNGQAATLLIVTKKEEVDAVSVVDGALAIVEKFKSKLGAGQDIIIYNDEGKRVKDRLEIVEFNALAGLITVLLILFAFLPGKIGVMSSASLPIAALGTIAMMIYLDANFNIITMIALVICLGNLVDNSVVVSEHYTSLREQGVEAKTAAVQAAQQFWIPFTASTITIIAAFIPMLVTQGVLGQFIRWIPIVVSIALTISLLESLTLLPARLQFLNPKKKSSGSGGQWFDKVEKKFASFVDWTLNFRYLTAFGLTTLIVASFFVTAIFNRFELFPADGVEYYIARFETPPQTRVQVTDRAAKELSEKVFQILGEDVVDSIIARSGVQQVEPGDPQAKNGENVGFLLIRIKQDQYLDLNIQDTLEKLRSIEKPQDLSVLTFESQAGGPPVGRPVTVTLRSSNFSELKREVTELIDKMKLIEGVKNIQTDEFQSGQEYLFKPNDQVMAFVGLNNDTVGMNLRAALEGIPVTKITERGIEFDVAVRYSEEDKASLESLKDSGILNPRGNLTRVSLLGDIQKQQAPSIIKGFNFRRSITVTADVTPEIITSSAANAQVRKMLTENLKDTQETSVFFGGEEESTNESLRSLAIALVLSIFGIFATLVFTFSSFSKPLLILSTIPLGLVGVNFAFTLNQRPLSFLAFIGVVGLSGVVINSAIILVDFIEELNRSGRFKSIREILVTASQQRLRAVLATGLTTVVGLLPTAFGIGGDDPLLIPITLALSWGMIIGTTLSLVWIPSCYMILDDIKNWLMGRLKFFVFKS